MCDDNDDIEHTTTCTICKYSLLLTVHKTHLIRQLLLVGTCALRMSVCVCTRACPCVMWSLWYNVLCVHTCDVYHSMYLHVCDWSHDKSLKDLALKADTCRLINLKADTRRLINLYACQVSSTTESVGTCQITASYTTWRNCPVSEININYYCKAVHIV